MTGPKKEERGRNVATPHSSQSDWDAFHQRLRSLITRNSYDTWIEPLSSELRDGTLLLVAPTEFHYHWVNDRFRSALQETATAVFGDGIVVELSARPHEHEAAEAAEERPSGSVLYEQQELPVAQPATGGIIESRLIPKYTFENFVVGQSNRFAHAAALAVAEQPGSHYNPLFIYADAGLGKTHLLHAVGHHRKELDPGAVIKYVSSEQFFNDFINGIRRKRMDEFKSRYRLRYEPDGVAREGWHEIDVRLAGPKGKVLARPGYLVPGGRGAR